MFTVEMAALEDFILILHSPDGVQWANFIAGRLAAPQYGITSISKDIINQSVDAFPGAGLVDDLKDADNDSNNNEAVGCRDSGRCSTNTISETSTALECLRCSKANVVLLSPDMMEGAFPLDVKLLNPSSTVVLFLGVDVEEARSYFGEESDHVFSCDLCVMDGSEQTICAAMFKIIEAFEKNPDEEEEEEDIYMVPPHPIQANRVEKVFPQLLSETERDLYVMLALPAEEDVKVILLTDQPVTIQLSCVSGPLYTFTVPDALSGDIPFRVEIQDNCIGKGVAHLPTKLDHLATILHQLSDPYLTLASALGVEPGDVGSVDTVLAFRLQQLESARTFKEMFPTEQAISSTEEHSKTLYPTLLHFAADYNLRTFCSQLLHYPDMFSAATTRNKDGELPRDIAARKGYKSLEQDLLQFVDDQKVISDSDNLYVQPEPPTLPPKPCTLGMGYVNEKRNKTSYIDMSAMGARLKTPLLERLRFRQKSKSPLVLKHYSTTTPQSPIADEVFDIPSDDSDDISNNTSEPTESSEPELDVSRSPGGTSRKAQKVLGISAAELAKEQESLAQSDRTQTLAKIYSASAPGGRHAYPSVDENRWSVSSNYEPPNQIYGLEPKQKSGSKLKNMFRGFIKKSSSFDSDHHPAHKTVKKSPSTRSDRSSKSSEGSNTRPKKLSMPDCQERDSGSYSDEEKPDSKKKSKAKVFQERERPMSRTLSKRQQIALNEKVDNAPTLPRTVRKRSGFKSFIDDQV
ncbi:uncharacterized protein LOC131955234 isoform X2 [Physella acuta]|uniref:uncharacterized protein LOC131955234 isoform X2 n=1 Tax=Physella acuta TaxID=109671 RepID=UPI0027DE891F|nr:uncharacterized protein LOC131955234 isoform X2 [Physella acuta]